MKTSLRLIAVLVIVGVVFGLAHAQFAKPEDAIKYRKSVMVLVVHHFKRIAAVVQGKVDYDKDGFAADAEVLKMTATLPWQAFMVPGTDKGDTTMNSAVFKNSDEFKKAAQKFETDTAKLAQLASTGDLKGSKAQFGAVAGNCKSCHDRFRTK